METIRFTAVVDENQVIRPPNGVVIPQGELEVTVRPLTFAAQRTDKTGSHDYPAPVNSYQEVMAGIRERQRLRGFKPPTREEVDAYLQAERDSWGD